MAAYIPRDTIRKFFKAVNPFAASPPLAPTTLHGVAVSHHAHSFSCSCKSCDDETSRLTRLRLKAQGA